MTILRPGLWLNAPVYAFFLSPISPVVLLEFLLTRFLCGSANESCLLVCTTSCMPGSCRGQDRTGSPGTAITVSCKPPSGCWGLNPSSLQEQRVPFNCWAISWSIPEFCHLNHCHAGNICSCFSSEYSYLMLWKFWVTWFYLLKLTEYTYALRLSDSTPWRYTGKCMYVPFYYGRKQ